VGQLQKPNFQTTMNLAHEVRSCLQSSRAVLQTAAVPQTHAASGGLHSVLALAAYLVLCVAASSAAARELAVACRHHLPWLVQTQLLSPTHPWRCCYHMRMVPSLLLLPSCQTLLLQTLRHPLQSHSLGTVVQARVTGQGTAGYLCCHQTRWSRASRSDAASAEPSAHPGLDSTSLGDLQHDGMKHSAIVGCLQAHQYSAECQSPAEAFLGIRVIYNEGQHDTAC
jgi:hypothetical protein